MTANMLDTWIASACDVDPLARATTDELLAAYTTRYGKPLDSAFTNALAAHPALRKAGINEWFGLRLRRGAT